MANDTVGAPSTFSWLGNQGYIEGYKFKLNLKVLIISNLRISTSALWRRY
jgi:hypothetical protein